LPLGPQILAGLGSWLLAQGSGPCPFCASSDLSYDLEYPFQLGGFTP